jgi:hypothetical protein
MLSSSSGAPMYQVSTSNGLEKGLSFLVLVYPLSRSDDAQDKAGHGRFLLIPFPLRKKRNNEINPPGSVNPLRAFTKEDGY